MALGDWLKGKRASGPATEVRRPDELVTAFDERGRELQIKRSDWVTGVLAPGLEKAWADPEALYAAIVQALQDDFAPQVAAAAERLLEVDGRSTRACIIAGIVRSELGDLEGAEQILQLSVDTHGATGVVLTNLAKVLDRRGEHDRAFATLRRSVQLDPNQDNGLAWWAALEKEKRGEASVAAGLEQLAKVPGAWRPQLWLAREKLDKGELAPALVLYDQVLSVAADEADVLASVTGALGQAGALEDLVRLAGPRYKPEVHGPPAGMNIVEGLRLLGRFDEALAAVRRLQAMPWPPLAVALAEKEKEIVAARLPRTDVAEPSIELLSFDRPLWTRSLYNPDWLLPARGDDTPAVVFFTLADETRAGQTAEVQMTDDSGRLTRGIPLYLFEAVRLRFRARALCSLMVAEGQGPVVFRELPPRDYLESTLAPPSGPAPTVLVSGSLVASGLRLQVWRAGESAAPAVLDIAGEWTDVGALGGSAEGALASALAARGVAADTTPRTFYRPPPPELRGAYVSALEQLLYQLLAANGVVRADSLWNERGFFETYVGLVEAWPNAPDSARLFAICGVVAAHRYESAAAEPYRKIVLQWLDEAPPGGVLRRLAPAVFQQLGDRERLEAWLAKAPPSPNAAHAAWLERVKAGES